MFYSMYLQKYIIYIFAGKGFNRTRPHNPIAPEPCRCKQGFHCSLINCEYCEAIEKCPAGEGVVMRGKSLL